jgi:chlorobactene glucosyltransferase
VNSLDFSSVTVNAILVYTFVAISCGWALLLIAHLRAAACTKSTLQRTVCRNIGSPLVSVIVPARNEMQFLRRCLLSILSQNYTNIELIVVDDCSDDETADIARSIADSRIRVINLKKTPLGWAGKSWASHVGYLASAGELLLFSDADSFFYNKEAISRAVTFLQKEGTLVATGLPLIELNDVYSRLVMPIYNLFSPLSSPNSRDLKDSSAKGGYLIGSFFIINKKLLDKIGGFHKVHDSIQEDTDLGAFIKKQGYHISSIKVRDSVSAIWSRDTRTLVEGIKRIVSYNLSNNKKNLVSDNFMIFFMMILPFILLSYNLYSRESNTAILIWNSLLCILPSLAVSITGIIRHRLNILYSLLALFGSSLLLTLYLANLVALISFPVLRIIPWKGRRYVQTGQNYLLFNRKRHDME